ncbi:MAG: Fe-S-containing hydro-lyase [Ruminococcus sp.]|nr:Fe-S-containing hydro-lyase [Ruminococcus sp.]
MSEICEIKCEELRAKAENLKVGDKILLTGVVYTARDAAHKRFFELLDKGEELPINVKDAVIYYAGPTPAPDDKPIGSCGPTTSGRMDKFAPRLLDMGLVAMIGKGERNQQVVDAVKRNKALYLCATGGAGALACNCVKSCEVVAFEELGCESVKKLTVERFPLIVANDCEGNDLFKIGRAEFCEK